MPLPALFAVAALTGAATLSSRAQAGSRARMTSTQAEAHKARLVNFLANGEEHEAVIANRRAGKRKVDLSGADLRDLAFGSYDDKFYRSANFSGANLTLSIFRSFADLSGANFKFANLTNVDFASTNLARANLTGASLSNAVLTGADLTNANLTDADLDQAHLPEGFLAPGTRLDAVPWRGAPYGWQIVASPRSARFLPLSEA